MKQTRPGDLIGELKLPSKGSMTTMPLDILVDEHGTVQSVYYGKDEGDHMPFSQIKEFAEA